MGCQTRIAILEAEVPGLQRTNPALLFPGIAHRSWTFFAPALILLLAAGPRCASPDRNIGDADPNLLARLGALRELAPEHRLWLVTETEPGRRLFLLGRLLRLEDGTPIAHHPIELYQADHKGAYDEDTPGVEASARLRGAVRTDHLGRFLITTILPGDYGATEDNRHIHTRVPGAKPDGYDFYFRPYINRGLLSWAKRSDQAMVLDLKKMDSGALVASADLVVKAFSPEEK